jgi:opacity protein-like surface antigen
MRAVLATLLLFAACAAGAAAQPTAVNPDRVFLWGGGVLALPASGGALATDYAPLLEGSIEYSSRAAQRLNVNLDGSFGADVGADVFFSRRIGCQAGFGYLSAGLSGPDNSDYSVHLRYVSRQPPDYVPREYAVDSAAPWPETTGHVHSTSLLAGLVVRAGRSGGRFEGTFAGGIQATRVAADIESVAYTVFRLGGHATLFETEERFSASTKESGTFVRPYIAASLGGRISGRASVYGGVRVEIGSSPDFVARPDRRVDPDEPLAAPELAEVQRVLTMEPLSLRRPRWQFLAGLRIRAH